MKKLLLIVAILFIATTVYGQTLKTGNLVGVHVITIELNAGITMEQFQQFHCHTLIPEFERLYKGWQLYLAKGIRGENKNTYGWIMVAESEETRDRLYKDNGSLTEYGKEIRDKMQPVLEEVEKFGKLERTYTDWVIL